MIHLPLWFWIATAVLLFWVVGAYNRLVRLRADITQSFAAVEAHIRQREASLSQWLESAAQGLSEGLSEVTGEGQGQGSAAHAVAALRAACNQVLVAVDVASKSPCAAKAMASLRLAEEVLIGARGRLSTELAAQAHLHSQPEPQPRPEPQAQPQPEWNSVLQADELAALDGSLGFARRQFNHAAQLYNDAATQFPTWVVAGVFGFRAAGLL